MSRPRLQRNHRNAMPPPMRLMPRDIVLLKAVADYRLLRQDQIQRLFFGSRSTAQYRLSHLYQHGFLARHVLPVYAGWSPTLYTVDKRGLALLRIEYPAETFAFWRPDQSHEFLTHTLAINDFRIAVTRACQSAGYKVVRWLSEADLKVNYDRVKITDKRGKTIAISLIPDSYFILETPRGRAAFFLENDQSTMTLERFQTKIRAYQGYVTTGRYQERYQTTSLRVLTVTNSLRRCQNLCAATRQVGGNYLALFRFTTQKQMIAADVLHEAIWWRPDNEEKQALISQG